MSGYCLSSSISFRSDPPQLICFTALTLHTFEVFYINLTHYIAHKVALLKTCSLPLTHHGVIRPIPSAFHLFHGLQCLAARCHYRLSHSACGCAGNDFVS